MPIYEYVCEVCDESHDALQKISDQVLTDCPSCTQPALKKKISAPGFRLSGSGWYETDFKSGNKRNLTDNKDKGTSESASTKKADSAACSSCNLAN